MSHHLECFHAALSALAGHGHIKHRLIEAFDHNLAELEAEMLPTTIRERYADLRLKLSRVAPLNGEGAICASVRKMSIDEADACARQLVDLYAEALRTDDEAEPDLAMPLEDPVVVPAMLLKSV